MLFFLLVDAFGLFSQVKLNELFHVESGNEPVVRKPQEWWIYEMSQLKLRVS